MVTLNEHQTFSVINAVNISSVLGNNLVYVGSDVSFDIVIDNFIKYNAECTHH